jgi:hypothetical protein
MSFSLDAEEEMCNDGNERSENNTVSANDSGGGTGNAEEGRASQLLGAAPAPTPTPALALITSAASDLIGGRTAATDIHGEPVSVAFKKRPRKSNAKFRKRSLTKTEDDG